MRELRGVIEQEIRERGPIPFSRYMELCLYHPELGYYSRNAAQFGKAGDFYTSSDVHAVFGRLLARQFEEMWRALCDNTRRALAMSKVGADDIAAILDEAEDSIYSKTDWVIVTRDKTLLEKEPIAAKTTAIDPIPGLRPWTDDFNNLYQILK